MLHKEFFGLLFLAFIAYIFVAPNPSVRIERVCKPIPVVGNVLVSMTALILPQHQTTIQGWVSRFDYGCQYIVWRMLYQSEYNEYMKSISAAEGTEPKSFDSFVDKKESDAKQDAAK